jgi:putative DNA primase/helicase
MTTADETEIRRKLRRAGYSPLPVEGKRPPLKDWQKKIAVDAAEIELWQKAYPYATNTGILTQLTPTIDIDITNPEAAEAVEALAREKFEERGYVLTRVGQSPKRAILLRTDKPFKKITGNVIAPNGDADQKIELLAEGQQIVVSGVHPKTGNPYAWFGGDPSSIKHEDLPYVTETEAKQFVADAVALLVKEFGYTEPPTRPNKGAGKGNGHSLADWGCLIDNIEQGRDLHDSLRDLAGKLIAGDMPAEDVIVLLRGIMQRSAVAHDERWQDRFDDIPRLVAGAEQRKNKQAAKRKDDETKFQQLSTLSPLDYQRQRLGAAKALGITVDALDKLVRRTKAEAEEADARLPHWDVEPCNTEVPGAKLLDDIERTFRRYIVLPDGAGVALALWTLHAWTMEAGDISPFLVLVSPTKRCGKTNTLTVLYYLTPRSELASNISPSALFRYIENVRPTLLIDEADSFMKENEEMRGILNSGHTKTGATVIRNVEVNGEHKPRRFTTWAPKAIATIRALADTLEDRAIVVQLQRKPKSASVDRLRKRDSEEFALLRSQVARWADDNSSKLTDSEPDIPDVLNDRAADNWRPLLAIADLAGGSWPKRARDAACLLSGEGHDATSINVELLADTRLAFGDTAEAIRSADLVAQLIADQERPWATWKHAKPLTQRQLAGLLRPFGIASGTVSVPGLADAKGYKRIHFEKAWEAYLPGQNGVERPFEHSDPSKRRNADGTGVSRDFSSVAECPSDGSKNAKLSNSHAGFDASTDRKPGNGGAREIDQEIIPASPAPPAAEEKDRTCAQCRGRVDGKEQLIATEGKTVWLHPNCERFYREAQEWEKLVGPMPDFLDRNRPRLGQPAISSGPYDDLGGS